MGVATTSDLWKWLVRHFHDYVVEDEPVEGTYGQIWFLSKPNTIPGEFAVKTLAPEAMADPKKDSDIDYLRREFRMWLALPPHLNVVPALGFETAQLSSGIESEAIRIPIMRMPKMDGSLQEWIGDPVFGVEDRLIALAQAFNGLRHLYKHGFEGHGDLKPSNILYADLRHRFTFDKNEKTWPSDRHGWQIRVADFGWADAWIDFGFTNKAFRQYLAPERLSDTDGQPGRVVPIQSDMFSMGVIIAELLQGTHPARDLKKAIKSEGKWKRLVEKGDWELNGIGSDRLKLLITRCLQVAPESRPSPEVCMSEICLELLEIYGQDIAPTLQLWDEQSSSISDNEHTGWAATQTIGLGVEEEKRSKEALERRIKEVAVRDFEACERWIVLVVPLIKLLECESHRESAVKISQLRKSANRHLTNVLGVMNRGDMEAVLLRKDFMKSVQPFERFSEVVSGMADIARFEYELAKGVSPKLGSLTLAALAFDIASRTRGTNGSKYEQFLSEAIRHMPDEAVVYYFRAKWRQMQQNMSSVIEKLDTKSPNEDDLATWIADLEVAVRLSPTWEEPKSLLRSLRSTSQVSK